MKTKKETILPTKIFYHPKEERAEKITELICEDCRISLTKIFKKINIPLSTVFDIVKEIEKHNKFKLEMVPKKQKVTAQISTEQKAEKIIKCLKENPRMPLTQMSIKTGIPISTVFDVLLQIKKAYHLKAKLEKKPAKE